MITSSRSGRGSGTFGLLTVSAVSACRHSGLRSPVGGASSRRRADWTVNDVSDGTSASGNMCFATPSEPDASKSSLPDSRLN